MLLVALDLVDRLHVDALARQLACVLGRSLLAQRPRQRFHFDLGLPACDVEAGAFHSLGLHSAVAHHVAILAGHRAISLAVKPVVLVADTRQRVEQLLAGGETEHLCRLLRRDQALVRLANQFGHCRAQLLFVALVDVNAALVKPIEPLLGAGALLHFGKVIRPDNRLAARLTVESVEQVVRRGVEVAILRSARAACLGTDEALLLCLLADVVDRLAGLVVNEAFEAHCAQLAVRALDAPLAIFLDAVPPRRLAAHDPLRQRLRAFTLQRVAHGFCRDQHVVDVCRN